MNYNNNILNIERVKETAINHVMLSIVIPVFNEELVIPEFHKRIAKVLEQNNINAEILYINDGSTDGSASIILKLRKIDPRVALINLSRNFGKEIAMTAGLNYSKGSAVVIIDVDLQDPPELIP